MTLDINSIVHPPSQISYDYISQQRWQAFTSVLSIERISKAETFKKWSKITEVIC